LVGVNLPKKICMMFDDSFYEKLLRIHGSSDPECKKALEELMTETAEFYRRQGIVEYSGFVDNKEAELTGMIVRSTDRPSVALTQEMDQQLTGIMPTSLLGKSPRTSNSDTGPMSKVPRLGNDSDSDLDGLHIVEQCCSSNALLRNNRNDTVVDGRKNENSRIGNLINTLNPNLCETKFDKGKPSKWPIEDTNNYERLSCVMCKNGTSTSDNALVKCQMCSKMYHQKCHVPKVPEDQVDPRVLWYCKECSEEQKKLPAVSELKPIVSGLSSKTVVEKPQTVDKDAFVRKPLGSETLFRNPLIDFSSSGRSKESFSQAISNAGLLNNSQISRIKSIDQKHSRFQLQNSSLKTSSITGSSISKSAGILGGSRNVLNLDVNSTHGFFEKKSEPTISASGVGSSSRSFKNCSLRFTCFDVCLCVCVCMWWNCCCSRRCSHVWQCCVKCVAASVVCGQSGFEFWKIDGQRDKAREAFRVADFSPRNQRPLMKKKEFF
ncbi:Integrator complex subunit 12, partial [Trichinella spiralis]